MVITEIDPTNREAVNAFIRRQWFTTQMAVHGECFDLATADGWVAHENGEIVGLITYRISGDEMEILSLDSLLENRGVGTALLDMALSRAKRDGLTRVVLFTTNDNLHALRFYQKRGFDMVQIHRNAVEQARTLKPEIPLIGMDNIPLRHEIELEMLLKQ